MAQFQGTVSQIENTTNKVTSISALSTDTQYPSAKAVYTALQTGGGSFIPLSALVTSITDESTDDEVPSAKCMYDIVGDIESILETLVTVGE